MATDKLMLGNITFEIDDLPENIPLGGEAMTAITKFPGGYKDVQLFGVFDDTITLTGVFNYSNAKKKVAAIDKMWKGGNEQTFKIGSFKTIKVIINNFKYTYQSLYNIAYSIDLEVVPAQSTAAGWGGTSTSSSSSSSHTSSKPSANAPSPRRVYTVKKGDCLWKIARKYYGKGSQYTKIAKANHLKTTVVHVGQKLVIP